MKIAHIIEWFIESPVTTIVTISAVVLVYYWLHLLSDPWKGE
jgi:hypothetical protein